MQQCPDKDCHDKVEDLISKVKTLRTLLYICGALLFGALGTILVTWSDVRTADLKYAKSGDMIVIQTQYTAIVKSIDDIKEFMSSINRRLNQGEINRSIK